MTQKEAIEFGKMWLEIQEDAKGTNTYEFFKMGVKAIKHDMPMKVQIEKWKDTKCPNGCGYELSTDYGDGYYSIDKKIKFCPRCGQRLDWNEEKESEEENADSN